VDSTQNVISFCTGFGGLELGIHRAGVDVFPVCYLENEAFCQANLVEKMETGKMGSAPIWSDLKTFDSQPFRGIVDGILCGYPCQPFSTAGKRKGKKDPRHLWPYLRKHIRTINPRWIFAENDEGHISLGLSTVLADLEEDGYEATFGIFSAEEAGAPHLRKRVYILAKLPDTDCRGREISDQREQPCKHLSFSNGEARGAELAHTENRRRKPTKSKRGQSSERGSSNRGGTTGEGQETKWPARPGQKQHDWEEPRVIPLKPELCGTNDGAGSRVDPVINRVDRLRLLGNGVVPQTAEIAWKTLWKQINEETNI